MSVVPPGYGQYLKSPARYVAASVAGAAAWGDIAADSVVLSPLADRAAAQAEAIAQAQFLAGPLARDKIVVKGLLADEVGRFTRIYHPSMGYADGAVVLILGAQEDEAGGKTTLTVLKRLYL